MPEHTPTPWTVDRASFDDCGPDECGYIIKAKGMVASVGNQRIVQAAPDTYTACKLALRLLTGNGMDGTLGHHPDNPVPAALRAAIKLAEEGRQD